MASNIINIGTPETQAVASVAEPDDETLQQPELYINRYLSLLEFNQRVLDYARDPSFPLLERLKHLCISSSNLDEFFEIRIAVLKQRAKSGAMQSGPDNRTPAEIRTTN